MKLKSLIWTLGLKPSPKTYGTKMIRFSLDDDGEVNFSKWLHPKDYFRPFDQKFLDQLRNYIQPGDTVLDIGAHCGDFTVPLGFAAGSEGCVFAFEPNPYVFEVLQQNAKLNPSKCNIIPVQAAVAEQEGTLTFNYSDPGFCNGGNLSGISRWTHGHPFELQVPAIRAAEWLEKNYPERIDRIKFIKIDTEGFDLSVVRSLASLIRRCNPFLHVEMYRHLSEPRRLELFQELVSLGYEVFHTDGDYGSAPGEQLSNDNLMSWEHYNVIAVPRAKVAA